MAVEISSFQDYVYYVIVTSISLFTTIIIIKGKKLAA